MMKRFGWLLAAASTLCATSATADTVIQNFSVDYVNHGSQPAMLVGGVSYYPPSEDVFSITIDYRAENYGSFYAPAGSTPAPVKLSAGFAILNAFAVEDSGVSNVSCSEAGIGFDECSYRFSTSGRYVVPTNFYKYFLNTDKRYIVPLGDFNPMDTFYVSASGTITYNIFSTVPEPATWGLMILGFGAVGSMVRHRRKAEQLSLQ